MLRAAKKNIEVFLQEATSVYENLLTMTRIIDEQTCICVNSTSRTNWNMLISATSFTALTLLHLVN